MKQSVQFCCVSCLYKQTSKDIRKSHWKVAWQLFFWVLNCHTVWIDGTWFRWWALCAALVLVVLIWMEAIQLWPRYFIQSICKQLPDNSKSVIFQL